MTKKELLELLQDMEKEAGTRQALALKLGVSPAYLGDVMRDKKEPAHRLLKALGLRRVVTFEKVEG